MKHSAPGQAVQGESQCRVTNPGLVISPRRAPIGVIKAWSLMSGSDAWQAAGGAGGPEEGGGHRGVQRLRAPALVETGRMAGRCESGASSWTAVDWRDGFEEAAHGEVLACQIADQLLQFVDDGLDPRVIADLGA